MFSYIEVWFTDQISKSLEIKYKLDKINKINKIDKINITLPTN